MAGYPKRTGRIRQVREFARRGGAVLESGPVRPGPAKQAGSLIGGRIQAVLRVVPLWLGRAAVEC